MHGATWRFMRIMSRGKITCLTYETFRLGTIRKMKSHEPSESRYRVVRKLRKNKLNKRSVRVLTIGKYIPLIYTFRNADFNLHDSVIACYRWFILYTFVCHFLPVYLNRITVTIYSRQHAFWQVCYPFISIITDNIIKLWLSCINRLQHWRYLQHQWLWSWIDIILCQ